MAILTNILIFLALVAVVWFFAGILIESVNRIARRFNKTGFVASFFILGFLTSVSELSVAVNSTLAGVPAVSVGNLIGASFVVLLLIVPLLAIGGKGIQLRHSISMHGLILSLIVVLMPAVFAADGTVSPIEGAISILAYASLLYFVLTKSEAVHTRHSAALHRREFHADMPFLIDLARIALGGGAVFLASRVLVDQAVYFASILSVPASLVSIILLSIGTNIPELVVAARSIMKKRKDIAFGDYVGSAAFNTFIFGALACWNGPFAFDSGSSRPTTALMIAGFAAFYAFAKTRSSISRREGAALLLFYGAFLAIQITYLVS